MDTNTLLNELIAIGLTTRQTGNTTALITNLINYPDSILVVCDGAMRNYVLGKVKSFGVSENRVMTLQGVENGIHRGNKTGPVFYDGAALAAIFDRLRTSGAEAEQIKRLEAESRQLKSWLAECPLSAF